MTNRTAGPNAAPRFDGRFRLAVLCLTFAVTPLGCDEPEGPGAARLEDGLARFRSANLTSLRDDVRKRLQEREDDAEALLLKARLARVDDDYYVAGFPSIEAVLATAPDHLEALCLLGSFNFDKGRLVAAEEALGKALAIEPTRPEALAGLAAIDMDRGDLETAEARLSSASAAQRAGDPVWLHWRGALDLLQGNVDSAIRNLERAHEIDRQDARIARKLAEALRVKGDGDRAAEVLRFALAHNPAHLEPPTDLGELLLLRGDADGVIALLEPLDDELESGRSVAILGRAYLAVGRAEDAEKQLQRALKFGASDRGGLQVMLARAQFLQGRTDEARQTLRRAEQQGASADEVERVRAEIDG